MCCSLYFLVINFITKPQGFIIENAIMDGDGQLGGRKVIAIPRELETLKLPEGWIGVNHYSGGIIYLHKKSRVVTWSRPYSIGDVSLRKHDVPVAAIPCLHQIFNLMEAKNEMRFIGECDGPSLAKKSRLDDCDQHLQDLEVSQKRERDVSNIPEVADHDFHTHHHTQKLQDESLSDSTQSSENQITKRMPAVNNSREAGANSERALRWYNSTCLGNSVKSFKIENIEMISPDQLSAYLSSIYNFEKLADEDAYKPIFWEGTREEPKIELPDVLKALPFNALNKGKEKDKFAHSPGSTHLSMLNEYCKKNIKKSVEWIDSICNDNQFAVEAVIDGIKYGRGEAKSKKGAKQLAAKNTLEILMPEPMAIISNFSIGVKELAVFDNLDIDDPTVADCAKSVGLSLPSDVLSKCLKRNQAVCDTNIYFKLTPCESGDRHTYEISCGKHSATGPCKNRRTGKQLASQAILKKIHPRLEKWGQLVRLYCSSPTSLIRESKKNIKVHADGLKLPGEKQELMRKLHSQMRALEKKQAADPPTTDSSSSIASTKLMIIGKELDL